MAVDGGQSDKANGSPSDADLARRLDRLSRDLDAERRERAVAERPRSSGSGSYALAFKLGSEFIAAVIVGAALGWGLDKVAGTSPGGLIVLLLLGFAAGVMNVMRSAGRVSQPGAGGKDGSAGPH
jgi:ATP synthase protein I